MIRIGIDPGSKTSPTAIAVLNDNKITNIHLIEVPKGKTLGGELVCFQNALEGLLRLEQPQLVSCEEPHLQGSANIRMCKFMGAIEMAVERYHPGMNVCFMPPQTIKSRIGAIVIHPDIRAVNKELAGLHARKKTTGLSPDEQKRMTALNKKKKDIGEEVKKSVAYAIQGKVTNNRIIHQLIDEKAWDKTDAVAIALTGKEE